MMAVTAPECGVSGLWAVARASPNPSLQRHRPGAVPLNSYTVGRPSDDQRGCVVSEELEWDVFISHASEDKASCVDPIAATLEERGYAVWYDRFTLKLGDSLRASIDRGLARSRFGVVVLSKAFFQKRWPKAELDSLLERELTGHKVILPVWHGMNAEEVRRESPLMASKLAVSTDNGIPKVVDAIVNAIGAPIKQNVVTRITDIPVTGTAAELEALARNVWWAAENHPDKAAVLQTLESVFDRLRQQTSVSPTAQTLEPVSALVTGPDRFDQFVAIGRSGTPENVDFLMNELAREGVGTRKLVDYVLGLVPHGTGRDRIYWYLYNGTKTQRNYAALYFKRRRESAVLAEAVRLGVIDRVQAFSR